MIEFDSLYEQLQHTRLHSWVDQLRPQLKVIFQTTPHGKDEKWQAVLKQLPSLLSSGNHYNTEAITVGRRQDISTQQYDLLVELLQQLRPWRKGPYDLFGIHIDTEWHSDWKWERIKNHLSPLHDKLVLDIGCGSGYHMWRMLGEHAKLVIGADPSRLFLNQFSVIKHYIGSHLPIHLLPLRSEDLPNFNAQGFDTVFSMGVLYHRKSPFNHLQELKNFLKPKGELVLETLVIPGDENTVLVPEDRYAKMSNVWFIPSTAMLVRWLKRIGFSDIKVVNINQTSIEEQRTTEWMKYESLRDFLDPEDPNLTIEGHPAPVRACLICTR